jgi:hypothetical protein
MIISVVPGNCCLFRLKAEATKRSWTFSLKAEATKGEWRWKLKQSTGTPAAALTAGACGDLLLPARVVALVGTDGDEWLEFQKALLADTLDVHQLFDLFEISVLLSVLDDSLRGARPDTWKRLQLCS